MKKILVTGAGGFIGGHLVKELQNRNYKVRAADIKPFSEWFQCSDNTEKGYCLHTPQDTLLHCI